MGRYANAPLTPDGERLLRVLEPLGYVAYDEAGRPIIDWKRLVQYIEHRGGPRIKADRLWYTFCDCRPPRPPEPFLTDQAVAIAHALDIDVRALLYDEIPRTRSKTPRSLMDRLEKD